MTEIDLDTVRRMFVCGSLTRTNSMKISKAKFDEIMRNFNVLDAFVFMLLAMVGILLHLEAFVNRVLTLNDIRN